MKALLGKFMGFRVNAEDSLPSSAKSFNRICIKDSTKFAIPKELAKDYPGFNGFHPGNALMNIQYEYDLLSGNWSCLEFTKATRNDQADSRETLDSIEEGDLHIRDLGYVTMPFLEGVVKRDAYFLNRLPTSINVYLDKNEGHIPIDWSSLDDEFKNKKLRQMEFNVILSKKYKLKSRMVMMPVPDEVYQKRIRNATKHAKSKGCQLTNAYKIKARYNIFITNVPHDRMSAQDIIQVYRLRWQIELVFKAWKSGLSVDKTKKVKKERFECQMIAKIIWALINWRIYQLANLAIRKTEPDKGISILKFFKQAIKYITALRKVIEDANGLRNFIEEKIIPLLPHLLVETKKGKTSHCQILSRNLLRLS